MEKLELSQLKYPEMRKELIDYIHGLSDREYQYQAWVEDNRPGGGHDELDYAIHFLYDDTDLADDPMSLIGWILTGKNEADVITNLVKALDIIFDKYGTELSDKEYLAKNEWENVLSMAKDAKSVFLSCN
ncbi:SCO4402 family protein [Cronobacter dublinensis]|uniref:SCO4402 family protein n=1 Tax=Cronobacter dublinensis TaxID=413497 RepID=UPI0024AEACF9|nr:hypothetical protein [Cronobacter dublinensis]ELQ6134880.1 hypothetical protein [Cronobacter dublinensis]ELY4438655.1 hypothetical protein [Cronobacter dublinensis]MDI7398937.1 hypothetical protein [Cronobacter dublinensis]MDI7503094.1 hypothetical protein [Cronobacter dublinensis]